jgi:xanthine/uracil permease
MQIQPWQIPVLVMAGVIIIEALAVPALRRWAGAVARQTLRTASLGLLAAVLAVVLVVAALGPSLADQLASVAAAIAGIAALWLTYRSHRPVDQRPTTEADRTGTPPAEASPPTATSPTARGD